MTSRSAAIRARGLTFGYGARPVLRGVDLEVAHGELVGLVGPNGAGKSTLLRLLLGFLPPDAGTVELEGRPIADLPRREVARRAAFVPQGFHTEFDFRVRDLVAMGRTPWLGRFRPEGEEDRSAVARAMEATEVAAMAERPFTELSGGERQRVLLARAFAQGTDVLLLDEPNASLDLLHAYQLLELVRRRVDEGAAALAALHDLSLAARFCDRLVVLHEGGVRAEGPPSEVLSQTHLAEVFGVEATLLEVDGAPVLQVRGPRAE